MTNLIGKNDESGIDRGVQDRRKILLDELDNIVKNIKPATDMYEDVKEFHKKFNAHIGNKPSVPPLEVVELRKTLLEEEFHEVMDALTSENLNEIAKELCDLIVIVAGTAVSYGIDLNPVWDLVHKSNMAKEGGSRREDGKILKPSNWEKPDIALEIKRQIGE